MDIIQEHIDLLRAQFDILQRMHGPVRRYRAVRKCVKGYNCGGSCITRRKNCRKALEGEAKNFSEWMVAKMSANIGAVVGVAPVDKPVGRGDENPRNFDSQRYLQSRENLISTMEKKHGINKWRQATNDVLGDIGRTFIGDKSTRMDGDPTILNEGKTVVDSSGKVWQRSDPPGEWIHTGDMADREGNVYENTGKSEVKQSPKKSAVNTKNVVAKSFGDFNPANEVVPEKAPEKKKKKDTRLTANQIADFQPGVDQVVRRGDQTYVVSGTGLYRDKLVRSDVLDDDGKASLANMSPDRLARSAAAIARTPYLSEEGRKERMDYIRELMSKQGDPMFG